MRPSRNFDVQSKDSKMKFTVSTNILLKGLNIISGSIGANSVLPILEDFLFKLRGNALKIFASDLETSMMATVAVDGTENGIVAVPARILLDTLKALPDQPLEFDIDNELFTLSITSETGQYKLAGENGEDFPEIPEKDGLQSIQLSGPILSAAIGRTLFATSSDELRPAMTGIKVEIDETGTRFIATDGHKLVKYENRTATHQGNVNLVLPKKAGSLLKVALSDEQGDVTVFWNEKNAFFETNGTILVCRLIDSVFPDVTRVIPTNNPNELTIDRMAFQNALKRIAIFASKTTYQVVLDITASSVRLQAEDPDFSNHAAEQLPCEYTGEDMNIAFNARFLIEVLSVLDSAQVMLQMSVPSRAGLVVPCEQGENEDLIMLVMPIMTNR